jgi:hypothetical protein
VNINYLIKPRKGRRKNIMSKGYDDGEEMVDFKATREELEILAYHYLDRFFGVEEDSAIGFVDVSESRMAHSRWKRFIEIAEALDSSESHTAFQKEIDRRLAEIEKLREEVEAEERGQTNDEAGPPLTDCNLERSESESVI